MKRSIKSLTVKLFAVLFVALLGLSCAPKTRSFEEMRLSFRESIVGPENLDLQDSVIRARLALTDKSAENYWNTLNKDSARTFLWEDCMVEGNSPITLRPYSNLLYMTIAYGTRGSKFYGNQDLKRDIIGGMEWMDKNRYNTTIPLYDNWWVFVIGTPLNINRIVTILYDDLTEEQKARYEAAMNHYAPNVTYQGASTGANKVWQCAAMAARGFLTQDPAKLQMAVDGLDTEFKTVTTHDGFYEDGSFVQHQWHAYTGGYGRSLLNQLTDMIEIVHGSQWEISPERQQMLYGWVRQAYEPLLYRGAFMDMVRGREMARPGIGDRGTGHSIMMQLFKLSLYAPAAEKAYLQGLVKAQALSDTQRDMISDIPLYLVSTYRAMMADSTVLPAPIPARHKQFAAMDRVVHTAPAFGLGLALSSERIENYETINEENLKGWYTSDGMTYLYDNDLRQYTEDFWPTVDPYRMAGTTVDTRAREAKTLPLAPGLLYADGYKSPQAWVGGSSIKGVCGVAGMWLDAFESTLEAKKSWFMVGDQIVALGAGINSTDNRPIETIVENRKMNGGSDYVVTLNGSTAGQTTPLAPKSNVTNRPTQWAHFAGVNEATAVGYYFPQATQVNALREERTGTWPAINGLVKDSTPITKEYFTLWMNHGKNPRSATYAYVLLPGRSAQQTADYAASPNIEILANNDQVQAVRHLAENVSGFNFWQATTAPLAGVSVNAPASVIMQQADGQLVVALSDPTHRAKAPIRLELDRAVSGVVQENPNVKVISTSPLVLEVNVEGALGRSREVTFTI